jgi:serine/threonine-protein kinase
VAAVDAAFAVGPRHEAARPGEAQADAARNLLIGILALQNNFISREALLAAFNAWVVDKARPIAEILLDQGALDAPRRALLEALAGEHLRLHDGDPQRSLAALSSIGSVRGALGEVHDPDVQASLAHVAAGRSAEDLDPTLPYTPAAGPRFRVLRPHARGGLGEVFVARDEELHREVALKQIQEGYAHDRESRARFVLEAEVTGGLEHPGIVPVYGLGYYDDGRPYYAMRFVKGDSLRDAIAAFHRAGRDGGDPGERMLAFRRLLQRFIDVCDAISYAHSRGVLHRDLKPGNVMLGRYGETLVVDWGLAKPMGRREGPGTSTEATLRPSSGDGSAPTQQGAAMGTPAFMSPEQAEGRLDDLGPASDVYSLGATLYCLLTGRPPFEGSNVGEILRRVKAGEFPPPRRVAASVPRPLEVICLKAMALRPEDRYASPRALAEDLEHWLADEPVSAWREPLARRLARWGRRHARLLAAAGGLLSAAVVALAMSTWLIALEKDRVVRAQLALADSNRLIIAERDRAEAALHLAEERGKLARGAFERALGEFSRSRLVGIPQAVPLRVTLAVLARDFYKKYDGLSPGDPATRLAVARAEEEAAGLHRLTGRFDIAREGYTAAVSTLTSMIAEGRGTPELLLRARERLANTEDQFAEMLRLNGGRPAVAEPHYREAARLAAELHRAAPAELEYDSLAARVFNDYASFLIDDSRTGEAEPLARQAVVHARAFDADLAKRSDPGAVKFHRLILPMALSTHGAALAQFGHRAEAEGPLREAVTIFRELSRRHPDQNDFQAQLADALKDLGKVLSGDTSRRDQALAAHDEAVGLMTTLTEKFRAVAVYPRILAGLRADRGATRLAAGQLDGARDDLEYARRHLAVRVEREPDAPVPAQQLGKVTGELARLAKARGRGDEARALLRDAIGLQQRALKLAPESRFDRELLERHRADLEALDRR